MGETATTLVMVTRHARGRHAVVPGEFVIGPVKHSSLSGHIGHAEEQVVVEGRIPQRYSLSTQTPRERVGSAEHVYPTSQSSAGFACTLLVRQKLADVPAPDARTSPKESRCRTRIFNNEIGFECNRGAASLCSRLGVAMQHP